MKARPLAKLLERTSDLWRDRVLTGLTVLMLLHLFVITPFQIHDVLPFRLIAIVFILLFSGGLLVLSRSVVPVAGIVGSIALFVVALAMQARGGHAPLDACLEATSWLLISQVIIWTVARAVFAEGRITYHRVVGAVLLYLTIGLMFVALFTLVGSLETGAFQGLTVGERPSLPSDLVYFSFATLTTVGYGDIVPVHPVARSLCNVEAIIGQLYPATLLARLVSLEQVGRSR